MKLFNVASSPNCKRVRVAARELELAIELVPLDFAWAKGSQYLALNPTGKVPTLIDDDGFVLWESMAILAYLGGKKPSPLWPTDPERQADYLAAIVRDRELQRPCWSVFGCGMPLESNAGFGDWAQTANTDWNGIARFTSPAAGFRSFSKGTRSARTRR